MKPYIYVLFITFCSISCVEIPSEEHEYVEYLVNYGYLSQSSVSSYGSNWDVDDEEFARALRSFQTYVRIDSTGVLDSDTKRLMSLDRCQLSDVKKSRRVKRYTTIGRWGKKHITYRIKQYSTKMGRQEVDSLIFLAFSVWSEPSGITVTRKNSGRADVEIWFGTLPPRSSNRIAFGNTKHRGKSVILTLNDDIVWSQDFTTSLPNLFQTVSHEIGHVLGLGHTDVTGAMMYPIYDLGIKIFSLHEDDIRGIEDSYKDLHVVSYPGRKHYRDLVKEAKWSSKSFKEYITNTFQEKFGVDSDIEDFDFDKDFFENGF